MGGAIDPIKIRSTRTADELHGWHFHVKARITELVEYRGQFHLGYGAEQTAFILMITLDKCAHGRDLIIRIRPKFYLTMGDHFYRFPTHVLAGDSASHSPSIAVRIARF